MEVSGRLRRSPRRSRGPARKRPTRGGPIGQRSDDRGLLARRPANRRGGTAGKGAGAIRRGAHQKALRPRATVWDRGILVRSAPDVRASLKKNSTHRPPVHPSRARGPREQDDPRRSPRVRRSPGYPQERRSRRSAGGGLTPGALERSPTPRGRRAWRSRRPPGSCCSERSSPYVPARRDLPRTRWAIGLQETATDLAPPGLACRPRASYGCEQRKRLLVR